MSTQPDPENLPPAADDMLDLPAEVRCSTCGHTYPTPETYCPNCGELNPLLLEQGLPLSDEEAAALAEPAPVRPWWRSAWGCLAVFGFLFFIALGVGLGLRDGLQAQADARQAEVARNYELALEYEEDDRTELASAALELVLKLDPTHAEARARLNAINEVEETPMPTATSVARGSVTNQLFQEAEALALQGNWEEAIARLTDLRDLEPTFRPDEVSEALYTAYYELGLRRIALEQYNEALVSFDNALVERPEDPTVTESWEKTMLYLSAPSDPEDDRETLESNLASLNRLYRLDPDFGDISGRLWTLQVQYADYLAEEREWCAAERAYDEALDLDEDEGVATRASVVSLRCEQASAPTPTPRPAPDTDTDVATSTAVTTTESTTTTAEVGPVETSGLSGSIYFSRQNTGSGLWEIIRLNPADGSETILLPWATQPAANQDGTALTYHSERAESLGLHVYNLQTGANERVTEFAEDVLPDWGGSNREFVFATQRAGDRRWQIFSTFADGLSEASIIVDGRTPALSPDNGRVVFLGADVQGNNPGLYTVPKGGGDPAPLTNGSSHRNPDISPQNTIAFMNAESGSWDIYTVPLSGGTPEPLVATSANEGLPTWSPDGQYLAYVSDQGGMWNVYVISAAGGEPQRLSIWGPHPDWLMERISWSF